MRTTLFAGTRRARQCLSLPEQAAVYNDIADEGLRAYGPKAHLYTSRFSEAHEFFKLNPKLREIARDVEAH